MQTRSATRSVLCLALGVTLVQCTDDFIAAPDGSHIDLTASPSQVAIDGDSAVVTAFVSESDGRPVDNKTNVTFVAAGGVLCVLPLPANGQCVGAAVPAIAVSTTTNGLASVLFRSGRTGATATITARSGSAVASTTISLSSIVAPAGAKGVMDPTPDTIDVGQTSEIRAFLTTAEGAAVPNGTRVVFATPDTSLTRTIVLTSEGFASTLLRGKKSGPVQVTLSSGTLVVRDTVVVR